MKILVVEDNSVLARQFKKMLESAGHTVDVKLNPLTALSVVMREDFDLMLVDLMLPEVSGEEFIARLRSEKIDIPVIVTTNMASGYDRDKLTQLGVQEIILKSKIDPDELRELVARYA